MLESGINTGRCQSLLGLTTVMALFLSNCPWCPLIQKAEVWRRQIRSRAMLNIGKCGCVVNGLLHDLNAKAHHLDHSAAPQAIHLESLACPKPQMSVCEIKPTTSSSQHALPQAFWDSSIPMQITVRHYVVMES